MKKLLFIIASALVIVSGCAENVSPNKYTASEVGVSSKVVPGVVVSKRSIQIDATGDRGVVGAAGGALIGAAGASAIGGSPHTNVAAGVGGALLGGVIGDKIQKKMNTREGFEYMIKLKDDSIVSVTQDQDLQISIGQKILIIYGAKTRIVPDETATH